MRSSAVIGSLVLHLALIAAAFALPAPRQRRASDPVTVDLFVRKPETPPEIEAPKAAPPEPVKIASRELRDRPPTSIEHPLDPNAPVEAHPTGTEPPPEPQPTVDTRPPGKVDLTLHTLPPGSESPVSVPSGTGTFGTPGATPGKKPWRMRGDVGNALTGKIADEPEDRFPLKAVGGGEYQYKGKAFTALIGRDGRVSFDDKSIRDFKGLSGGFDITDLVMKAKHEDPYRAEKAAFMNQTEAMRKKMTQADLRERRLASLTHLPETLDRIWHDTRMSTVERRKQLFETWKDASMSESEIGDAAKEAGGIIETYVRRYLPQGSEDAFTDDELERYNRGQRTRFQPYR